MTDKKNAQTGPKTYRVTNADAGPRGFALDAGGTFMVDGGGSQETTLSEADVERAQKYGLTVEEVDTGDTGGPGAQTENLPAAGQVDPNHPDAPKPVPAGEPSGDASVTTDGQSAAATAPGTSSTDDKAGSAAKDSGTSGRSRS